MVHVDHILLRTDHYVYGVHSILEGDDRAESTTWHVYEWYISGRGHGMVVNGLDSRLMLIVLQGLTVLISSYYVRSEQQTRFAFLQSAEVVILATGGIVNFGLNQLNGRGALGAGERLDVRSCAELMSLQAGDICFLFKA